MNDRTLFNQILNDKDEEIKRLRSKSTDFGFMHHETVLALPIEFPFAPVDPGRVDRVKEDIMKEVTAEEYRILTSTRYSAPKANIIRFIEIINRLLEKGVFDSRTATPPVIPKPLEHGLMLESTQEPAQEITDIPTEKKEKSDKPTCNTWHSPEQ